MQGLFINPLTARPPKSPDAGENVEKMGIFPKLS